MNREVNVTAHSSGWSIKCPHCGEYLDISPDGHNPKGESGECHLCYGCYYIEDLDGDYE